MAGTYDVGDSVRCTAKFRDENNQLADPSVVIFRYRNPAGNITSYTFGVDVQLQRHSIGVYYIDVDIDSAGSWFYRFEATGTVKAASESKFTVRVSKF